MLADDACSDLSYLTCSEVYFVGRVQNLGMGLLVTATDAVK